MITNYIILWEYDRQLELNELLNYEAGIWFWTITPINKTIIDDNGNTGYYEYQNDVVYNIQSMKVDGVDYLLATSLSDCRATNKSFFYDVGTTNLYIHFDNFEPPLNKVVNMGIAVGYSYGSFNNSGHYYNNFYYEPRIDKIFNISKKKDPLYYGSLKFVKGKIDCLNEDGHFDNWQDRNLFAQATRLKLGNDGDAYSSFTTIFSGYIENDSTNWEKFTVNLQDIRAGLTRPIASNLLTLTDYPNLNESNIDTPKPVAYGDIYGAECICLNEEETAATYTFLLCDTEFNNIYSLNKVLVEGVDQTANATLNASAGTFTLATAYYDPGDEVIADFTVNIKNGVDIIKDLIANYDDKPYLSSFWDLTETAIAQALSRNTSLYIDDDTKLSECIESICFDIDGLFFSKDNGLYTIRIYDEDREPVKTIKSDEWVNIPDVENEGSQYLTSAIIKYKKNLTGDTYLQIENRDYESAAFDTYKRYKVETFETMLTTESDANLKAQTILVIALQCLQLLSAGLSFRMLT